MILRLDAPKRRGAIYRFINETNIVIVPLGILSIFGGFVSAIATLVTLCIHIGPDNGDEQPLLMSALTGGYFLVALIGLVAFFVADERWGLYDDSRHKFYSTVKDVRENYQKIKDGGNTMLIDAADGLVRDVAALTARNTPHTSAIWDDLRPRTELLSKLAHEANLEMLQRAVVGDTNLESATHALEAVQHARKELSA